MCIMQCKICGSNLVRGFTFCLECGTPVPPEMLEESGLPDRNIDRGPQEIEPPKISKYTEGQQTEDQVGDLRPQLIGDDQDRGEELQPQLVGGDIFEQGQALKPKLMGLGEDEAGEALKPKLIGGEEQTGSGEKVRAAMQNSSDDVSDTAVEKLIFCPNCGMHMQHNLNKCEICGMTLGNKPNNVPTTSSGIPLFNTEPDPFSGTGGLGNFTGGFGSISDEDVARIDNFANGNPDPMFNSGSSAFNVQATPNDFAHLTEQLANFSTAAGMPTIEKTKNTRIRQQAVPKGKDVEISDFSMSDDLESETIPMSDRHVPVLGDHSMEENPDEFINLDPFAFVSMSMDDDPPTPMPEAQSDIPEAVPVAQPQPTEIVPVIDNSRYDPVQPPSDAENALKETVPEKTAPEETSPFIAEETPVLSKYAAPSSANTEKSEAHKTVTAAPTQPEQQEQPIQQTQPVQQAQPSQQPQAVQAVRQEQPQAAPQVQQYQQMQPDEAPPRPAEKTKKCYACGRSMPAKDKFCPNCGRSMFGAPNPNLISNAPPPPPAKKKPVAAIVIAVIVLIAAVVAAVLFLPGKKSEAVGLDELSQVVSSTEQALLSDTVTEYFTS